MIENQNRTNVLGNTRTFKYQCSFLGCSPVGKNIVIDSMSLTEGLDEVTYRFSCKQGYELFSPKIAICKGGKWNINETVLCIKGKPARS